jgi:hypothetical protein
MNTGLSVRDRIKYMERMRFWFESIFLLEDKDNPIRWVVGEGYYALTTISIINNINSMITKYNMGVSNRELEIDRDMLNRYRELYNRNLNTTMDSLITTI